MAQVEASYSRNSATKHTGVDNLFDPARAEELVGTGVDVSMNSVVLNDVDASTLVLTAVADDDMLLLNTCVDGVGVAVHVILEVADDVNISVVAAHVAEDDVLLLEAAAEADVEVLVPPAVLGNAISATVEGPGVQVFTALAVFDVDEDELLDPARAEVLLGSAGVGVEVLVNTSVVAALVAEDNVLLLEAGAEADVEVLVPPAVLGNAVSATVEGPEVEVLASPAVLEDVAFALGKNSNEPSSPVKLVAGLASLAPIGVSVVGPVESATIEVQVRTEVKLDSAWSDTGHGTGEEYTASPLRVII